ncbi:MAG: TonB-dependent receptor [Bacteroidia bacterium]|nr:TonB-dependent receptor [Bacteroidia bacterium]
MLRIVKHTFLFCLLFAGNRLYAQSDRIIKLIEADTNKPLANIDVIVDFRPEGPLFAGKSDSFGIFKFNHSGAFKLVIFDVAELYHDFESTYTAQDNAITVKLVPNDVIIDQVTITGLGGPRSTAKNPYMVRTITREKIARMGSQNLGEVLQNETNIQLGQDQVLGTSAIMQGIGGQDIKILVNGIPLIGRVNGNIDVSQIPVSNIERVEIIEGPMSVVYGTDALGGVINIITRYPVGGKLSGRVNAFTDNLSNYNLDVSLNTRINPKTPLMFNMGRYFFTGRDFDPETRVYDWKPKTKYFGDASFFINGKNSTHRFTSSAYSEKLTDRSEAEFNLTNITGYNSYYYTTRFDNSSHSVFKMPNHKRFEWQNAFNYYNRAKNTIKRNLVTGDEVPYRPEDQDTTAFTLFNSRGIYSYYNPGEKLNWIAGYDFNQEKGYGKRIPADRPGITDAAIFGSLEYKPNKSFEIRPSLRLLYNSRFGNTVLYGIFGDKFKLAPLIPSLQVKYNMSEHLTFRGSYAKGFRAPSLKELNFYFVDINHNIHGNEDLKAETSDNFILSFDYRHKLPQGKGTIFNFSLFNNIIRNKINLALVDARTNYYTYINIGRFRSQGLNVNFEFFTPRISYGTSISIINVFDLLQQEDSISQKFYLNGQLSFNLSYKFPKQKMAVSLFSRYTSPTNGYTENSQRYKISGYYLMDVTCQKTFAKLPLSVNMGIKNILGVTSVNSSRTLSSNPHSQDGFNVNISPGRTVFLQLNYNFNSFNNNSKK